MPKTAPVTATDKEMAIAIGNYIIRLQRDITALEHILLENRIETLSGPREIQFRQMASKIAREEGLVQRASEQRYRLLRAVGDNPTDSSWLIRALHREFLEEESNEPAN